MIRTILLPGFRAVGDIANLVMLAGFAYATLKLHGFAVQYLEAAGGLPHPSLGYFQQVFMAPDLKERLMLWGLSWLSAVASLGTAWMTVLGLRWAYLAICAWFSEL